MFAGIRYSGACRVLCSHHVALLVQLLGHSFQVRGVEEGSRRGAGGLCEVRGEVSYHVSLLLQLLGRSYQVWGVEEVSRRSV